LKNPNLKSLLLGAMIPIIAMLFMGAISVLERYHTIKAKEIQLIDEEGHIVLSLSDYHKDVLEKIDKDTPRIIMNLQDDVNAINSRLNTESETSNTNFVSESSFNEKVTSLESMMNSMNDLNVKMNQSIIDLEAKLDSFKPVGKSIQEPALDMTSEIEILRLSLNDFTNSTHTRLEQVESDIERISSNQDMLMKILRKDLKKLNKK
jgi:hypothetical protein